MKSYKWVQINDYRQKMCAIKKYKVTLKIEVFQLNIYKLNKFQH